MTAIVCPVDNKDDAIQKVSAIRDTGISSGDFMRPTIGHTLDGDIMYTDYEPVSGTSSTELAQKLKPPDEPEKPKGPGSFRGPTTCAMVAILGAVLAIYLYIVIPVISKASSNVLVFVILFLIMPSFFGFLIRRFFLQMDKGRYKREEADYLIKKGKWGNAMKRWDRLYYCHKHGIVFDPSPEPGMGETCDPKNFESFVYQMAKS